MDELTILNTTNFSMFSRLPTTDSKYQQQQNSKDHPAKNNDWWQNVMQFRFRFNSCEWLYCERDMCVHQTLICNHTCISALGNILIILVSCGYQYNNIIVCWIGAKLYKSKRAPHLRVGCLPAYASGVDMYIYNVCIYSGQQLDNHFQHLTRTCLFEGPNKFPNEVMILSLRRKFDHQPHLA